MSWKTVAAVVADWGHAAANAGAEPGGKGHGAWDEALDAAASVAESESAHLEVLCVGLDPTEPTAYYAGTGAYSLHLGLEQARESAEALRKQVEHRLRNRGIAHDVRSSAVPAGALTPVVGSHVRFADLAILPRPYRDKGDVALESVLEIALFAGGVPILVVPPGLTAVRRPRRVVLAWDDSTEALHAARAALPLLRDADEVLVTLVDPPLHATDHGEPGNRIATMLARHGVRAEVAVLARTMPRVADMLCRHVADQDADLVVMGAYGHSRMREAIIGGATRHMLEMVTVPMLMAH